MFNLIALILFCFKSSNPENLSIKTSGSLRFIARAFIVKSLREKSPSSFDFETGDFLIKDGKVQTVSGYVALKQWIQKMLKTEQNKYKIYNTNNVEK